VVGKVNEIIERDEQPGNDLVHEAASFIVGNEVRKGVAPEFQQGPIFGTIRASGF